MPSDLGRGEFSAELEEMSDSSNVQLYRKQQVKINFLGRFGRGCD